ncbi:efflux RND transporter periplasmic adaptor subunit [Burkholderia cenocepacia]|uniref:Fusaric acid resistance transport protein n=1 Tax=Burkholderia cenocepacia (strain ATCC BAA-245 / DSM 16553 / LMG 16656 / NCTC 13227 / J2315 / CF5610) TaxID=216591 RepID=B4EDQ6_BURCJ|nr:HlyD family secretion protein [Burkholderia cenocepacia]KIS46334.1 efflux transporter, RND family, MFP subunit [Burkholderia cepacia]EPZ87136.1 HlyD family secretion protein [Burkholderia cenocepacia K56-2Valvano]ERI30688.1 HlyD family secretion protein [Burkholderia cenocepacia BC7]KKI79590.1 membrane protein [Burkholderia cenocepacia]MCG0577495.1 HlyD family secretion protein [Burkholderia cenocepacia]
MNRQLLTKKLVSLIASAAIIFAAFLMGHTLWSRYVDSPWTRDGRVRAEIVNVAPDVSGAVVDLRVHDNQHVKKGDLIMEIDPSHYRIAVDQARAVVSERLAELQMRQSEAARRADLNAEVVSNEARQNAAKAVSIAEAQYRQAAAQLESAKLNLARTLVIAPVDGYVTNLNTFVGNYAIAGIAKLAIVDTNSFWVYGYFEETKIPRIEVGSRAEIQLMSGGVLRGYVEGISRGIYDRDNPQSHELVADVNPTFNWVRLAQRVPVRIRIDAVPKGVLLAAGLTCTVVVDDNSRRQSTITQKTNAWLDGILRWWS